jgi:hypothetical protein
MPLVPLHDHGGGSGGPISARDLAVGVTFDALTMGIPFAIACFIAWRFLRRLTLLASGLWAFCVGVTLAPLIPFAIFGVDEVCDPPWKPCRFTEPWFSLLLLLTFLAVPPLVGWALSRVRLAQTAPQQ